MWWAKVSAETLGRSVCPHPCTRRPTIGHAFSVGSACRDTCSRRPTSGHAFSVASMRFATADPASATVAGAGTANAGVKPGWVTGLSVLATATARTPLAECPQAASKPCSARSPMSAVSMALARC